MTINCKSFEAWCAAHNVTLPKISGDIQEEWSLAIWLMKKIFRFRKLLAKLRAISEENVFESCGT